jgi:hypothetical protein
MHLARANAGHPGHGTLGFGQNAGITTCRAIGDQVIFVEAKVRFRHSQGDRILLSAPLLSGTPYLYRWHWTFNNGTEASP